MAITTDSIIDIGTFTEFKIGLSKTINQYTTDEIYDYAYCSSSWDMFRHINDTSYDDYCPGRVEESEYEMPFHFEGMIQNFMPAGYNYSPGQIQYNQGEKGIYGKIIWLCKTGQISMSYYGTQRCITNTDDVKIVTQMDMTKVYLFLSNYITPTTGNNNINYLDYDNFKIKEDHSGVTDYSHPANCSVFPAVMFIYNNKLYLHRLTQNSYTSLDWSWWLSYYGDTDHGGHTEKQGYHFNAQPVSFDNTGHAYLPININRSFSGLRPTTVERHYTASVDIPDVGISYQWEYAYVGGRITSASLDKYLENASWYGCMFMHSGTYYKPIIENGYVTGYTDDMSTPSDIDNWTDATRHNVPPSPPAPSGDDEDNTDPISTVAAPFGTGLAHYYVTTVDSVTLQHISEAMSTWDIDNSKKDLYKNLISCKIIKPPAGIPSTSGVFTIYGVKLQYNGADITIPEVTGNPSITLGPYSISRKFNDFRDYAPYSKAEIFIPYCGWTALPSHVIGRSVYVDYFTDVIAGTVKAVIRCGNNAVAEAAGVMAVDIPFAAQNVGAKVAAATTGMLSYGQGALQTSVGIGQAVATKGKSGIKNITSGLASVIAAYNQMAMVNNENWTEINGKSGDGCALAGIDTIIIKITRPKYGSYTAPYYVPADYGHTVGFVSMKKTTVGSCTGLIICDNVDTSGISGATDRERQLIKEYLESGVIVKHPE